MTPPTRNSSFSLRPIQGNINQTIILDNFLSNFETEQFLDKAIYGQSKVMGFDPKVINNLVRFFFFSYGGNETKSSNAY